MKILLSSICYETGTDLQLALYYLKSYLLKYTQIPDQRLNVKIQVFNENQPINEIAKKIINQRPSLVGFSCYLWNIERTLRICRLLKKNDQEIKIVLGGPEVSHRAEDILSEEKAVDIVVRGEGEATFLELVDVFWRREAKLPRIKGISFREGRKIFHNPDRPNIAELGMIPSPYLNGLVNLKGENILDVPLETTRGCLYRCSYCYYHKNFTCLRFFSLKRIEKELKFILSQRPSEVYLMDATFNANYQRAIKILKIFRKYNRGSSLHLELMAEFVDERLAQVLGKIGFVNIEIGIQSTNPRTLRAINRPFDKERFRRGIRFLNKFNLFYEIQLIDALPFQSYDDLKESLEWLYDLHPSKVVILRLVVLAGTVLRQQAARYGIKHSFTAPYQAYKSNAMSETDVLKVDKLRFAMDRLYDSQVFQETLYALKAKAGIKISTIMDDWIIWESKILRKGYNYVEVLNNKLPEFMHYLLRKNKKLFMYKLFLPGLQAKLDEYKRTYYR
ncbi:MAG: cobalamin-dependent protein [Candidatus Omnitrophica bacterium]|nr:cobalamin-dependent protein [Candidatus Omnitrophota bacterium]